jgi:PKD repeat protein
VVNHTFLSEGNYQVHLTVRSANQSSEGILDGSETIPVEVTPQSALMRVFANGQQLNTLSTTKIGTAEAQRGVVLDGAATVPTGGRTIQSHTRTVSSNSTTLFSQTQEGRPDIVSVVFPTEGQFTVELTVLDNQNNTLTEEYIIVVSDPLAVIKPTPEQGNTSTTFRFDASASYSLVSSIRLYSREIFDADNNRIDTFQGKSISKQFAQPGPYTVRLSVEDDQGRRNSETLQLYVDSTDPLAQFRMTPTEDRQYPSQFRFDAGLSSDVDVINADDELLYQRRFTPETDVVIEEVVANGRQIIASFNEPGLYQAKLLVQDSFGKTDEIVKEIEIESALRPTIFMSPKATNRDIPVTMIAGANLPIISYERDFGDGATNSTTATPRVQHTYQTIGAYPVTLTVYGADNQSNTITDQVFIGEKDAPVVAFRVTDNRNSSMKQVAQCEGEPAYLVYRRDDFMINTSDSINTQ